MEAHKRSGQAINTDTISKQTLASKESVLFAGLLKVQLKIDQEKRASSADHQVDHRHQNRIGYSPIKTRPPIGSITDCFTVQLITTADRETD